MNYFALTNTVILAMQSIDFIMPFLCNSTQGYWCQISGYTLKHLGISLLLNQSEYTSCIQFCHKYKTCKAFQYNSDTKNCRFTTRFLQNVEVKMAGNYELFWKKSDNASCARELEKGKLFHVQYIQ